MIYGGALVILLGIVFYLIFGQRGLGILFLLLIGSCVMMRACS